MNDTSGAYSDGHTVTGTGKMSASFGWEDARNLLCVRLDSLGDVLMTTPAIRALKEMGMNFVNDRVTPIKGSNTTSDPLSVSFESMAG